MKCFVMMPFDSRHEPTYQNAIKPAVSSCKLECLREDEHRGVGDVIVDIRKHIKDASICIADLTGLNQNVIYETALAHSEGIPVILITQDDLKRLPFDLRNLRTIKFEASTEGYEKLRKSLKETIKKTIESPETPVKYLEEMLVPSSIGTSNEKFVIAASPLSWQKATMSKDGFRKLQGTQSDHVGIRGLIQAFGLIYGLDRLPDLLDPGDYIDDVLKQSMHLYAIGSPKVNRWTGLLLKRFYEEWIPRLEFKADSKSKNLKNIRVIIERDDYLYMPDIIDPADDNRFKKDFGLLLRGPYPGSKSNMFMVLAGRSSLGTEAACRAATDPKYIQKIKKELDKHRIEINDHKKAFYAVVAMDRRKKTDDNDIFESVNLELCTVYPFRRK